MSDGIIYDWDSEIQNDGEEFVTLPAGDYNFEIKEFVRGRHEPKQGGKLPACPKATLKVFVDGGDKGKTYVTHRLFLHSSTEGFLCAFFTAIGQRSKGQKVQMNWNQVPGATGSCKLGVKTSDDGNKYNEIKRFLPPAETPAQGFQNGTF